MSDKIKTITSERVLFGDGKVGKGFVDIKDGRIDGVYKSDKFIPKNSSVKDYGNLVVMPGLVDTHVHVNEPGRTEWEGFVTATKAAAAGGITTIVDMPLNCDPVTTSLKSFQIKLDAIKGKLWVNAGFYGGIVPGNFKEIRPMAEAGVLGFKAFMVHSGLDEFPHTEESDLRKAMPEVARCGLPLLVHAELDCGDPLHGKKLPADEYQTFLLSRPHSWEYEAIKLLVELCEEARCHTHVVHLSSAEAIPLIDEARRKDLPFSVETCPHYLTLKAEEVEKGKAQFKCTPPIRDEKNQNALWDALVRGKIDFVVSDHSPCIPQLKQLDVGDFMAAWGGISSLQLGLSSVWTAAKKRGLEWTKLWQWMSLGPAKFVCLDNRKGKIAEGYDADLVVWSPEEEYLLEESNIHHRHKLIPYLGKKLNGVVKETYVMGEIVFSNGKFLGEASGRVLRGK